MSEMEEKEREQFVRCRFCDEKISPRAKKCKHCGEIIDENMREIQELKRKQEQDKTLVINNNNNAGNEKYKFPHIVHLVLTIITGGLWLIIWIIHYILNKMDSRNK